MRYEETVDAGLAGDIETKTNIQLFEAFSLKPLAKILNVQFLGITCLYYAFKELSALLIPCDMAAPWGNVSTLIFPSSWHDTAEFDIGVAEPVGIVVNDIATKYAECLSKAIPNVAALILCNQSGSALHKVIENKVIESHASNIRSIATYSPLSPGLRNVHLALTRLIIRLEGDNSPLGSLPRVCARSLRYLHISGMSDGNAWQMFSGREEAEEDDAYLLDDITFPRLCQLRLHYNYHDAMRNQGPVPSAQGRLAYKGNSLRFPRLERLQINPFSLNSTFFAISKLPSKLLVLDVKASASAVAALSSFDLPTVERLRINQNPMFETQQVSDNVDALNDMLKRHHGARCTEVFVECEESHMLDPRVVELAKITALSVDMPLRITDMLELLQGMPDLSRLSIRGLEFCGWFADLQGSCLQDQNERPSPDTRQPESKIRRIEIEDCEETPATHEEKRALAKHLIAGFPTLLRVEIAGLDDAEVSSLFCARERGLCSG
ncbi:hypothetical protein LPJ59_002999 [Coemansia sp. RSA 2399]|nr:hypothetical protein LPJ59_002999 [Coemansia sp. RSA 2399]KAJ1904131.1 hypothetical protein LPJ81_002673 [Coemansia sp. IMI 209127]